MCHYVPLLATIRTIRYSGLFAVRYSRLFAIRYSGFPDTHKSHYVREIVSWLGFADFISVETNDSRKYVCVRRISLMRLPLGHSGLSLWYP